MGIETIGIDEIKPSEYNPRKISSDDLASLKRNIKEFGCVVPLIINKDRTLIAGHQRLKVLNELKYKEVNVIIVDLDKDKEKLLNISLNRIQGDWNNDLLETLLKGIDASSLNLSGFTEKELEGITKNYDFTDLDKEIKGLNQEELNVVVWIAKFVKKDFVRIEKTIQKIKVKNKMTNYKSEESNSIVMKELCKAYETNPVSRA